MEGVKHACLYAWWLAASNNESLKEDRLCFPLINTKVKFGRLTTPEIAFIKLKWWIELLDNWEKYTVIFTVQ